MRAARGPRRSSELDWKETSLKRTLRILRRVGLAAASAAGLLAVSAASALAGPGGGAPDLGTVLDNLRTWLIGLLATAATLALTVGGLRYIAAGGDPGQIEKAKTAFKGALVGYALAALAPALVAILKQIVGV